MTLGRPLTPFTGATRRRLALTAAALAAFVLSLAAAPSASSGVRIPDTIITSGPTGETTQTSVSFGFVASLLKSTFQCNLDGARWASCSSPKSYSNLAPGPHTFQVRAKFLGKLDRTPATRSFTIVAPPPPAPSEPTSTKLSWAPPVLTNPITINVSETQWLVSMDKTKDYIVDIGHHRPCAPDGTNRAGLWLEGGHNVVLIGGRISIPCESTAYGRTAIKIRGATGTVHVEGVLIDNSGGYLTDGVAIAAPEATVQLQNLRIGPVWDSTSAHPDLVQVQGGVAELRIDHLTGTTTYQGIFLKNEGGIPNGPTDLRRVNVHTLSGLGAYTPNIVFWQETKDIPVSVSDFYVDRGGTTRDLGMMAHPTTSYVVDGDVTRRAVLSTDKTWVYWPSSNITGTVTDGNPPSGDFVPSGVAGEAYVSPGYG